MGDVCLRKKKGTRKQKKQRIHAKKSIKDEEIRRSYYKKVHTKVYACTFLKK